MNIITFLTLAICLFGMAAEASELSEALQSCGPRIVGLATDCCTDNANSCVDPARADNSGRPFDVKQEGRDLRGQIAAASSRSTSLGLNQTAKVLADLAQKFTVHIKSRATMCHTAVRLCKINCQGENQTYYGACDRLSANSKQLDDLVKVSGSDASSAAASYAGSAAPERVAAPEAGQTDDDQGNQGDAAR